MNAMLLAGLTDHKAAAIEIMVGMTWHDQRVLTIPRGMGLGVPEQTAAARACQYCVLDLFGFGLRKYSPENEARLLEFLAGRSAVLLVWGAGGGWTGRRLALAHKQNVVWVSVPYSSAEMLVALKEIFAVQLDRDIAQAGGAPTLLRRTAAPLEAAQRAAPAAVVAEHLAAPWRRAGALLRDARASATMAGATAPAASALAEPPIPAWQRAMALAEQLKAKASQAAAREGAQSAAFGRLRATPLTEDAPAQAQAQAAPPRAPLRADPVTPPPGAVAGLGLSNGALAAVLGVFPALNDLPLIGLAQRVLAGHGKQLLSVGRDPAFIADVLQGWLAAGITTPALLKMLHTPELVERMDVAPLPADDVEASLRQLFGGRYQRAQRPLDMVMWVLMADSLKQMQLVLRGDLAFRLHRFPNFMVLEDMEPLDIQLACICARMPQSIGDLVRAFPRREAEVYRFAILCIVSGLASVTNVSAARAPAEKFAARVLSPNAEPAAVAKAATAPAKQTAARRGFFKSLLDKLF